MRYTNIQYAKALVAALEGKREPEQKAIRQNFLRTLRTHRVWPRLNRILSEIEKEYLRGKQIRKVEVESASGLPEKVRREIFEIVGKNVDLRERANPELLAGMKILIDDELLIDASGRRQLRRLFSSNPLEISLGNV